MFGFDIESCTEYGIDFTPSTTPDNTAPYVNGFTFVGGMITGKAGGKACVRLNYSGNYLFWKNMIFKNSRLSNDGYDYTLETYNTDTKGLTFDGLYQNCTANNNVAGIYGAGQLEDENIDLYRIACSEHDITNGSIVLKSGEQIKIDIEDLLYVQKVSVTTAENTAYLRIAGSSNKRIFKPLATSSGYINVTNKAGEVTISNVCDILYLFNNGSATVNIKSITVNRAIRGK
jgi:hypothetical protein